ncbi:HAMP domain-containing sensor histidine kinase [Pigmentiphaga soli]|uniref:sensor histidine kinase n=1 Tax=Pigmentiphaga soli TaxID=1007095 RepID=UPI0031EAD6CA
MSTRRSLRLRVTWALTGAVALFVALQAVLVYLVLAQQEDALVDQIVMTEASRLVHRIENHEIEPPAHGEISLGPSLHAWYAANHVEPAELPAPLRGMPLGARQLEPGEQVWHVVVADAGGGRVYVVYDATANEARVYRFGAILVGLWLACVLAGYCLSRVVAGRVVRPMVEVTDRIAGWAPGAPVIRVDRDDEAGRLIEAFNRVQDRVDRSIAREREFSANLSHEVRTPLTAIRTDAELAGLDGDVPAPVRERLARITRSVDEIAATLDATRAISSAEPGPKETVVLAECLGDAWSGLREQAARAGLGLVDEVPRDAVASLDRYGLLIVLRNLIRNAIDHAAPATLTIRMEDGGLSFADDGPGIPAADLPFLFERYYRGRLKDRRGGEAESAWRGLGLAIAKRVCDLHGWRLSVSSRTEGAQRGTRFTLQFD